MEVMVGASIFFALFILIAGVMWLKEISVAQRQVEYTVLFPNVGALQKGDPINVNGVKRGQVAKMYLRESDVAVIMKLDRRVTLTDKTQIIVQNIGIMGERMIGVQLSSQGQPFDPSTKNDTTFIRGQFDSGIAEAMGMMGEVLADVETLVERVGSIVEHTVGDTAFIYFFHELVARLDTITVMADAILNENRDGIQASVSNIQTLSSDIRTLVADNHDQIDAILDNGSRLTTQALSIADRVDSIAVSVSAMLTDLEEGEGSVGKLIHDDTFYADLKSSVYKLDSLIDDVDRNGLKLRVKLGFGKNK
jgi:phospholipid/cholesterol/gamma-HCH transport system substrate-binding protein